MTVTTYRFHEVFEKEVQAINQRRDRVARKDFIALEVERDIDSAPDGRSNSEPSLQGEPRGSEAEAATQRSIALAREPIMRPTSDSNVVGLALSGGGIRSASFCLGALQALDKADVLKNIDYLSTVSGGGYIGASLSAGMTCSQGKFPFKSSLSQNEPFAVQHIRDHSNYLFPSGILNPFYNIVIYLRGLIANALLILPWLLFAAAITIFFNPTVEALDSSFVGKLLPGPLWSNPFATTLTVLCLFAVVLLAWGVIRSFRSGAAEIPSRWTTICALTLLALLGLAFLELQPVILSGLFESRGGQTGFLPGLVGLLQGMAAVLAPFSAAVALFSRHIGRLLKQGDEKPTLTAAAMRALGKVVVYVAGAAIPFLLWMAYLYLAFIGIRDYAGMQDHEFLNAYGSYFYHTPDWLRRTSEYLFGYGSVLGCGTPIAWFYMVAGALLLLVSLPLTPNANSLHRLYRDRLSKAFLFDPCNIVGRKHRTSPLSRRPVVSMPVRDPRTTALMRSGDFDLAPLDRFKLSKIDCTYAPYHLINTALNIQGSKYANRRSRNADFFMFSPLFVGSHATKYVPAQALESKVPDLDLATAMAVSGAAASSNMGANSIKALAPTLAILNVRLGYWLPNPRDIATRRKPVGVFVSLRDQVYFLREMFAGMREDSEIIYLTDGGHIENLGIYELLRRRCRVIIAIDAEADPEMSFGSLVTLQRYARIDLGIIISLPWADIRDGTRSASAEIAKSGGLPPHAAPHGPHCAVGKIQYPHGREGILIYVKSSLSGDENDYIIDYKRRFPSYPHETTADQLFSEEQFEVYRALGFHAVNEMFSGSDHVGMRPKPARWQDGGLDDTLVRGAKDLLNWK